MTDLFKLRISCDDCGTIQEHFVTATPNPDKQTWYKGFLCADCVAKRKNLDRWERFANAD